MTRITAENLGMKIEINKDCAKDIVDAIYDSFKQAGNDIPKYLNDALCGLTTQLETELYLFIDKENDDDEMISMSIEEALHHINEDFAHPSAWIDYDENDWVEGMLEFGSYDIVFEAGQKFYWTDPDDGACSGEVILNHNTRVRTLDDILLCDKGEFPLCELTIIK